MLGYPGAILEQLGDKMAPKSATMSQDTAQERQDDKVAKMGAIRGERQTRVEASNLGAPP